MTMDKTAINGAALRFRAVMDEHYELLGDFFHSFPRGCCGDTSELLAAYLEDQDLGNFAYVSGWSRAKDSSHAWLERDELIIDVTADQFQTGDEGAMVTTDPTWHAQFSDNRSRKEDGDFRSESTPPHLEIAYAKLMLILT